jgi:glycerophosphoryl diester phosphodiesterase
MDKSCDNCLHASGFSCNSPNGACKNSIEYKNFKSKEDNEMDIKINRKVITEEKIIEKLVALCAEIRDKARRTTAGYGECEVTSFAHRTMEICKNEPQEVENVELEVPNNQLTITISAKDTSKLTLTPDQIKQIQQIKL